MYLQREHIVGQAVLALWFVSDTVVSEDIYYNAWDMYIELSSGHILNMQVLPDELNTDIECIERSRIPDAIEFGFMAWCYGRNIVDVCNSNVPSLALLLEGDLWLYNDYDIHGTSAMCISVEQARKKGLTFIAHWGGKPIRGGGSLGATL